MEGVVGGGFREEAGTDDDRGVVDRLRRNRADSQGVGFPSTSGCGLGGTGVGWRGMTSCRSGKEELGIQW